MGTNAGTTCCDCGNGDCPTYENFPSQYEIPIGDFSANFSTVDPRWRDPVSPAPPQFMSITGGRMQHRYPLDTDPVQTSYPWNWVGYGRLALSGGYPNVYAIHPESSEDTSFVASLKYDVQDLGIILDSEDFDFGAGAHWFDFRVGWQHGLTFRNLRFGWERGRTHYVNGEYIQSHAYTISVGEGIEYYNTNDTSGTLSIETTGQSALFKVNGTKLACYDYGLPIPSCNAIYVFIHSWFNQYDDGTTQYFPVQTTNKWLFSFDDFSLTWGDSTGSLCNEFEIIYPKFNDNEDWYWRFPAVADGTESLFPDVNNGASPYSNYRVTGGSLPGSFVLNSSTGELTRPEVTDSNEHGAVVITVDDSATNSASTQEIKWKVIDSNDLEITYPPKNSTPAFHWVFDARSPGDSLSPSVSGGASPYGPYEIIAGELPENFDFNSTNGIVSRDADEFNQQDTGFVIVAVEDDVGNEATTELYRWATLFGDDDIFEIWYKFYVSDGEDPPDPPNTWRLNQEADGESIGVQRRSGQTPITYALTGGRLPAGFSLDANTGTISEPDNMTSYIGDSDFFEVTATDNDGETAVTSVHWQVGTGGLPV